MDMILEPSLAELINMVAGTAFSQTVTEWREGKKTRKETQEIKRKLTYALYTETNFEKENAPIWELLLSNPAFHAYLLGVSGKLASDQECLEKLSQCLSGYSHKSAELIIKKLQATLESHIESTAPLADRVSIALARSVFAQKENKSNEKRNQIERLSQNYLRELDQEFRVVEEGEMAIPTLYAKRDLEDKLFDWFSSSSNNVAVVIGEAGTGKTSLLWHLCRTLQAKPEKVVLAISATWILADSTGNKLLEFADLTELVHTHDDEDHPVILMLDTADLLLHEDISVDRLNEFIAHIAKAPCKLLLTCRPEEAVILTKRSDPEPFRLTHYSENELAAAIHVLSSQYVLNEQPAYVAKKITNSIARGLPVVEICRSPFLLRMLFELCDGRMPELETDITGLYETYWDNRIQTDTRRRTQIDGEMDDYTLDAMRVAIALFVLGTPATATRKLFNTARRVTFSSSGNVDDNLISEASIKSSVDVLVGRGVLVRSNNRIAFRHQTLFEFVAARGLANRRDGAAEFLRLTTHLSSNPLDLFVGAVAEHLGIELLRHWPNDNKVIKNCVEILKTGSVETQKLAATVALHANREFEQYKYSTGLEEPTDVVGGFRHLPSGIYNFVVEAAATLDLPEERNIVDLLRICLERPEKSSYLSVLDTVHRFAKRDMVFVWPLFNDLLASEAHHEFIAGNATRISSIISEFLSDADICTDMFTLERIAQGENIAERIVYLRLLLKAQKSSNLWSISPLESIISLDDDVPKWLLSDLDLLTLASQNWLGSKTDISGQVKNDNHMVCLTALKRLQDNPKSVETTLALAAFAYELSQDSEQGVNANWSVALSFMDSIMGYEQKMSLIPLLFRILSWHCYPVLPGVAEWCVSKLSGLPAKPNKGDISNSAEWASAIREVLSDSRTDWELVRQSFAVYRSTSPVLWFRSEYLVASLPMAFLGGSYSAAEAIKRILSDPSLLNGPARGDFFREYKQLIGMSASLDLTAWRVAMVSRSYGWLKSFSTRGNLTWSIIEPELPGFLCLLESEDRDDRDLGRIVTSILSSVHRFLPNAIGIEDFVNIAGSWTSFDARKEVVGELGGFVDRLHDIDIRAMLSRICGDGWATEISCVDNMSRAKFLAYGRARVVLRDYLCRNGSSENWGEIRKLCLLGDAESGMENVSSLACLSPFVHRLCQGGEVDAAWSVYDFLLNRLAEPEFSGHLGKEVANRFYTAAFTLSKQLPLDKVVIIASRLDAINSDAGETLARAIAFARCDRGDARDLTRRIVDVADSNISLTMHIEINKIEQARIGNEMLTWLQPA